MSPLAAQIRPKNLDEVVGQSHLLGKGRPLREIIRNLDIHGNVPCMLFYGPSGIGKTTIANIIAEKANMTLRRLNGTSCSTADIKAVIADIGGFSNSENGILLYLDEIQFLNKKQQQNLLEYIENGDITLIASTTENPYFYVYGAILSRCTVFEFKALTPDETLPAIKRAFEFTECELPSDEALQTIAQGCGGDVRKALNAVELCVMMAEGESEPITVELVKQLVSKSGFRYDRSGDEHFDTLSAFHKSMRGSDENAALHYLARLIIADDLPSICRRLLCVACEDVGLAFPNAITIVKACVDSAIQLGFPEARLPLSQATILLCTAPKSNSALIAIDTALADVRAGRTGEFPRTLQNVHCDGADISSPGQNYLYPHDYPMNYVEQQYLPDVLKDRIYYNFADNKYEKNALNYRNTIQKGKPQNG
ncbi:MAG: replication-associated recombination protein A [Oscillospiraceae bacterium]|nr:replication-associated recombination protein A [Oscillospiraceae bacterium]